MVGMGLSEENKNWRQHTGSHVWNWFKLEWLCLPSPYRRLSAEWKLKIDLWGEVLGLHFGQIEGQHTWRCKCTSINSEPCGWIIIVGKQQSSPNFDDPVSTVSYFEATSQFKVLASVSLLALCQKTRTHCLTILYFKEIEPIILKASAGKIGSSEYVCDLDHKQCVINMYVCDFQIDRHLVIFLTVPHRKHPGNEGHTITSPASFNWIRQETMADLPFCDKIRLHLVVIAHCHGLIWHQSLWKGNWL